MSSPPPPAAPDPRAEVRRPAPRGAGRGAPGVGRYASRLRRRALAVVGLRVVTGAVGGALLALVGCALAVGPLASGAATVTAWLLVSLAAAAGALLLARPLLELRRRGPASLLRPLDARLAGELRSALELGDAAAAAPFSGSLVRSHALDVERRLALHPPRRVVPWRRARAGLLLLGAGLVGAGGGVLAARARLLAGLSALSAPMAEDASGDPLASIVRDVAAELTFPAYMRREPSSLPPGGGDLVAPRGTSARLSIRLLVPARAAVLEVRRAAAPARATPARVAASVHGDRLAARLVVDGDATWTVRVETSPGRWVVDRVERRLRVEPDRPPMVRLLAPRGDVTLEPEDEVLAVAEIEDDWGVRSVELVVAPEGAPERRRRLASSDPLEAPERTTAVDTPLSASRLGLAPGEQASVWIEATDTDDVGGPHVGRSVRRTVRVASELDRHAETLGELARALDVTVGLLGDRLEHEVPPDSDAAGARARFELLRERTEELLGVLGTLEPRLGSDPRARRTMAGVVATLRNRLAQALGREWRLHDPVPGPAARRAEVDGATVEELESASLTLEDLLGRARIDDARLLARELAAIRSRMGELLDQLERTGSPETRAALLAELARLERRMRELAQQLGSLAHDVPTDFVNPQDLATGAAADRLHELREAIERGDLAAARRALLGLAGAVGDVDRSLQQGAEAFEADRFGPEQRALQEVIGDLEELGTAQGDLSRRAGAVRRRLAEQAGAAASPALREQSTQLAERARATARSLDTARRGIDDTLSGDAFDRARQRADDAAEALSVMDLDEARRMAEAADEDLQTFDGLAFPPSAFGGPRAGRDAREAAARARSTLRQLRRRLEQLVPRTGGTATGRDLEDLRDAAGPQRQAAAGATRVRGRLAEGPTGMPLSLDGAETMRQVEESMRAAAEALERGDARRAGDAQERAGRGIEEVLRTLQQQGPSDPSQSGGGEGSSGRRERVEIPEGGVDDETRAFRRRVQEAMREAPPDRYRDTVRRYWREIAR